MSPLDRASAARLLRPGRLLPTVTALVAVGVLAASPAIVPADRVSGGGALVAYDPTLVPAGAAAHVTAVYDTVGDSELTLAVTGLVPGRTYGAHVHALPCDPDDPAGAGPRFQAVPNPDERFPHDPRYVNPVNEIWLDVTTDADGAATTSTRVPWQFHPRRRAASVMIHEHATAPGPYRAGWAGEPVACVTVAL